MTPKEMREAAVAASKAGESSPGFGAVVVTLWTVGAEIVEALWGVESTIRDLEELTDKRTR